MRNKTDRTDKQENYIRRLQSTLNRIDRPFDRPSKPLYQGHPNIIVAVSMGLQSPATAIAIDVTSQKILAYRSTKQLLGDNYQLLNRQRNQQMQQRHLRHNLQKQGRSCQLSNSELGEHLEACAPPRRSIICQSDCRISSNLPCGKYCTASTRPNPLDRPK